MSDGCTSTEKHKMEQESEGVWLRRVIVILLEDQRTFEQSPKQSHSTSLLALWTNSFCRNWDQQRQRLKVGANLSGWRLERDRSQTLRALLAMARSLGFTLSEMGVNGRF